MNKDRKKKSTIIVYIVTFLFMVSVVAIFWGLTHYFKIPEFILLIPFLFGILVLLYKIVRGEGVMISKEERYREVEKRERLVQAFLIIGGFLVAYTREEFQRYIVLFFGAYLMTTILYYIFLSRTRDYRVTDYLAFLSSYIFSFIILVFIGAHGVQLVEYYYFWGILIGLIVIFTYAFLSPERCERIKLNVQAFLSPYLFSWDNVPGNDNERLLMYFRDDLGIGWVESAEISKSDDGKTIRFFKDKNSAEIIIAEKEEKATLKISDGRTQDLKVKEENGKLNIYRSLERSKKIGLNRQVSKFDYAFVLLLKVVFFSWYIVIILQMASFFFEIPIFSKYLP